MAYLVTYNLTPDIKNEISTTRRRWRARSSRSSKTQGMSSADCTASRASLSERSPSSSHPPHDNFLGGPRSESEGLLEFRFVVGVPACAWHADREPAPPVKQIPQIAGAIFAKAGGNQTVDIESNDGRITARSLGCGAPALVYIAVVIIFLSIVCHRLKTGWAKGSAHWADRAVESINETRAEEARRE